MGPGVVWVSLDLRHSARWASQELQIGTAEVWGLGAEGPRLSSPSAPQTNSPRARGWGAVVARKQLVYNRDLPCHRSLMKLNENKATLIWGSPAFPLRMSNKLYCRGASLGFLRA